MKKQNKFSIGDMIAFKLDDSTLVKECTGIQVTTTKTATNVAYLFEQGQVDESVCVGKLNKEPVKRNRKKKAKISATEVVATGL